MSKTSCKNSVIKKFLKLILGMILMFAMQEPAFANIHTYPDGLDQIMYRSQQSFRDSMNRAWQLVLYKRLKNGTLENVRLRLVGFPGSVEFTHPTPLNITTGTGESWQVQDVWNPSLLPLNVGEYDASNLMNQLDSNSPLRIDLPLNKQPLVELVIPPFAVQEWRDLISQD
jgi:hypothetical protein